MDPTPFADEMTRVSLLIAQKYGLTALDAGQIRDTLKNELMPAIEKATTTLLRQQCDDCEALDYVP